MPTKPKLSRQDLMAFFQDIMQGDPLINGENTPSMEQRMKAAVTLMALLDKQPEEEDGLITFKVAPHQIDAMQESLYQRWETTYGKTIHRPHMRRGRRRRPAYHANAFPHQTPSLGRQNPVERGIMETEG
jgi:hypothetical protein